MGVLTKKYRPKIFEEVIGQDLAVKLLKAVAKDPKKSPNSMVLSGAWGTGKTTLARIFGRALSCYSFQTTGKICLKCKGCLDWEGVSNRYIEFDSSMVGNVSQIKELRPVFEMVTDYPRVIVLDESHLMSRQAQSALLKVIEEGVSNTFFLLCSTDPELILDTIHSRSLPVEFNKVDSNIIMSYVKEVYEKETGRTDITSDVLTKIAFKSDGHVRDALMLLEGFIISGDEILDIPLGVIHEFFDCVCNGDKQGAINIVARKIVKYPAHLIQKSLNFIVMQFVQSYVTGNDGTYSIIAKKLGQNVFALFKNVSEGWVQGIFTDKYLTASFFLTIVNQLCRK